MSQRPSKFERTFPGVRMRVPWRLGALFVASSLVSAPAASDEEPCRLPCDCHVRPTRTELRYRIRGDRCEGYFEVPISTQQFGVRLVSFVALPYGFRSPGNPIDIEWPAIDRMTHLKVEPRQPRIFYRMDRYAGPKERSFIWPTDALKDVETSSDFLGVTVSAEMPDGEIFIPAKITQGAPQPATAAYQVTWLIAYDADAMVMTPIDAVGKELPDAMQRRRGPLRAGAGVSFLLAPTTTVPISALKAQTTWKQGGASDVTVVHIRFE